MEQARVKTNYWAIIVAAIACFMLEAIWYSIFLQAWLDGLGRTRDIMMHQGISEYLQYATALVAAAVMAIAISTVTQLTGPLTARRAIKVGALLWFAFVFTTWSTEYVFEVRSFALLGIKTGFWLLGAMVMGAIVGTWKKK
jgi:Protein of unknown function (DUF1761)